MKFEALKSLMEHFVEKNYAPGNCIKVFLNGKLEFEYSCGVSIIQNLIPSQEMNIKNDFDISLS